MYVTGSHTLSASTSDNAAGYFWVAYGQGDGSTNAGLYKSSATTYLIESDNSSATVDISDPGSEGFGMNVTVPTGEAVAGTGFGDNAAGIFGSLGMGVDNAELIAYRNWGPQETTAETTITYGARAGSSAEAGTYSETVTFVCGGYFGDYESNPYWWTLDFDDLEPETGDEGKSETNTETIPEDVTLYLYNVITEGQGNIKYRKNSGSLVSWTNNTTVNFSKDDTLSIEVSTGTNFKGMITLKLDNSSGRSVAEFYYWAVYSPPLW